MATLKPHYKYTLCLSIMILALSLTACNSSEESAALREAPTNQTPLVTQQQTPRYSINLERELLETIEVAEKPETPPKTLTSNPYRSRPRGLTRPGSTERYAYYDTYAPTRYREYQPAYGGRTPSLINRALNLNSAAKPARIYR